MAALAGVTAVGMIAAPGYAFNIIYDAEVPSTGTGPDGIVPLIEASNPGAKDFLAALADAGKPVSVKVFGLLSSEVMADIFDDGDLIVENIFLDLEDSPVADKDAFIADLAGLASDGANIGNFSMDEYFPDQTLGSPFDDFETVDFGGLNIANPKAYPGAPDYRSPASGNSAAPSILSALFTLPIDRVSGASAAASEGTSNIPWATRMNVFGNDDLDTDPDGVEEEFAYDGDILSRGDFGAQVAHYRARGSSSIVLFEPGVVGYSKEDQQSDALDGWEFWDDVTDGEGVTLTNRISVDGSTTTTERAGAVWSGVANDDVLKILVSNLSDDSLSVELPFAINGNILSDRDFEVGAGTHLEILFGADGFLWDLVSTEAVFDDDDRSGIAIPEPASLAMLLMGAGLVGVRRRSTK